MSDKPVRDLTEWLLQVVRQRPAMYMGKDVNERGIWTLQTYLLGYEMCHFIEKVGKQDRYLDGFTDWVYAETQSPNGPLRLGPILTECNDDPVLALQRFFEYLEIFDREIPFAE